MVRGPIFADRVGGRLTYLDWDHWTAEDRAKWPRPTERGSMAKMMVTWLGEDDQHKMIMRDERGQDVECEAPGPSFMMWGTVRFDKDRAVLIDPDSAVGDKKLLLDQIALKVPKMKRFKCEPADSKKDRAA